jgi:flagellar biosynthesis protein FlhG
MAHSTAAPRPSPLRAQPAPVIAIASGKGGVGKTWLSATLATIYGRQSRRCLLVDADLGLANIDVQLGVRPQADLASVVRGFIDFDAAVTPIYGGPGKSGFDLLPGHSGSGVLANFSIDDARRLIAGVAALAVRYERLIVDLPAGIDAVTIEIAASADRIVVVTTEEPTALTDAYAFIKILRQASPGAIPCVVVNMAEKRVSGRRIYDQLANACEAYLGARPALGGVIVRDPAVPDCIRAQTALPIRHPSSNALDDAMRIAEHLSGAS